MERVTTFRVINDATGEVVMTLEGCLSASFDEESGTWGEVSLNGVSGVMISDDNEYITALYFDGHEESILLQ